MSFPRYERCKDSGVEWLGEVPEHWGLKRLILLASINDDALPEDTDPDFEMEYLDISSVTPGQTKLAATSLKFGSAPSRARRRVKNGDILVSTVRTYLKAIAPIVDPPDNLIASTGFAVVRPRDGCSPVFLNYALQSSNFIEEVIARSTGVSYPAINAHELGFIKLPLPQAKQDQECIGQFIETETAKIDALIEEQRRLTEMLKEKRQAVISHAITKGLGQNVPMKDSGVYWIGDIPKHWSITSLRYYAVFMSGSTPDRTREDYWGGEIPWVKTGEINYSTIFETEEMISEAGLAATSVTLAPAGTLLMALYGQGITRGRVALLGIPATFNQACVGINPDSRIDKNFLYSFFVFAYQSIREIGNETTQMNLNVDFVKGLRIVVPPIEEQCSIASFVKDETQRFDALITKSFEGIALLQERRSALISEAVTGRIDVRVPIRKPVASEKGYSSGFAHQLLAAEILDRCNSQRMGRIKLQKLIHLCEYHGQVSEVQGDYSRKAAGPFDARAMAGISKNLKKQKWFEEVREGERYVYRPLEKRGEHKKYLTHWQAEMPRIDEVLSLLGNFKTRECEIVSTLYAAWNDLLIDGGSTDDAAILHESSSAERWHKSKEQIAPERWKKALQWMKDKGLVPVGYGKHTRRNAEPIESTAEVANEPA